jgi:predicted anti-sigma-YlaC factor YlaD
MDGGSIIPFGFSSMEVDPNSHDAELQSSRLYAIASIALGVISLCAAIIPACGGILSILGVFLGFISMRTEKSREATAGVAVSVLGLLISIVYFIFLSFFRN